VVFEFIEQTGGLRRLNLARTHGFYMSMSCKRTSPWLEPENCCEVRRAPVPISAAPDEELENLKSRLLAAALMHLVDSTAAPGVERAASEAAALAWAGPFPLLLFPELFDEKAADALVQARRQAAVRERSRELMMAV
jgi:hypothetical protein